MSLSPTGRPRAVSVVVQRSRLTGNNRAYVRLGGAEAGYRDLHTGAIVTADPANSGMIAVLTNHLLPRELRSAPAPAAAPHACPGAEHDAPELQAEHARADEWAAALFATPPTPVSAHALPRISAAALQPAS